MFSYYFQNTMNTKLDWAAQCNSDTIVIAKPYYHFSLTLQITNIVASIQNFDVYFVGNTDILERKDWIF